MEEEKATMAAEDLDQHNRSLNTKQNAPWQEEDMLDQSRGRILQTMQGARIKLSTVMVDQGVGGEDWNYVGERWTTRIP